MTTLTDRQTFRETVAQVAEKARARLPETVNGRIESAIKLVLAYDVMPQADGSILVGSSTDALKSYLLTGQSCECQDFTRGQAPDGWCQHRIAAGIHKRVQELLPPAPAPDALNPVESMPLPEVHRNSDTPLAGAEAPASCNVYLMLGGHRVQVTLRDGNEQRMLERLQILLDQYPVPQPAPQPASQGQGQLSAAQFNALAQHRPSTGVCPLHQVAMKENTKDGRTWWSHKTAEGQWCKGR